MTSRKIILTLTILLVISVTTGWFLIKKYKHEADMAQNNLSLKSEQWRDEKGRLVYQIDQSTVSIRNMKNIFKLDSTKIATEYQKRIYSLKGELDALNVKYRNLLSYSSGTVTVRDSFIVKFIKKDTTLVANYNDGYLDQNFEIDTKMNMKSDYTYTDTVNVMDVRRPKLKENGKKHFPNWGNLPWVGWDKQTLMYSNNPKASYSGVYSIKTER